MDLQRKWIKLKKEIRKATSDLEANIKNIRDIIDKENKSIELKEKKELEK